MKFLIFVFLLSGSALAHVTSLAPPADDSAEEDQETTTESKDQTSTSPNSIKLYHRSPSSTPAELKAASSNSHQPYNEGELSPDARSSMGLQLVIPTPIKEGSSSSAGDLPVN